MPRPRGPGEATGDVLGAAAEAEAEGGTGANDKAGVVGAVEVASSTEGKGHEDSGSDKDKSVATTTVSTTATTTAATEQISTNETGVT